MLCAQQLPRGPGLQAGDFPAVAHLLHAVLAVGALLALMVFWGSMSAVQADDLTTPPSADLRNTSDAKRRCLVLSESPIRATDLAGFLPGFRLLPPETIVGYLPDPGVRLRIRLPRQPGDALASPRTGLQTAPDPPGRTEEFVCVERRMQPLTPSAFSSALKDEVPDGADLALIAWGPARVPEGHLVFPRSGLVPRPAGTREVLWRGNVQFAPGRSFPVWLRARVSRPAPCLYVRRTLRPGEPIPADALESRPCGAEAVLGAAFAPGELPKGMAAATLLRQGDWAGPSRTVLAPVLPAGGKAQLSVNSGTIRIQIPVIAEEAGRIGETIWVRTSPRRTRLRATVVAAGRLRLLVNGAHFPNLP